MASDAACIDSAAGSMCPFAQFHGGGGADESGQLPVDADSKEGVLVQILMRQSQTLFGGVFLRRVCGFPRVEHGGRGGENAERGGGYAGDFPVLHLAS